MGICIKTSQKQSTTLVQVEKTTKNKKTNNNSQTSTVININNTILPQKKVNKNQYTSTSSNMNDAQFQQKKSLNPQIKKVQCQKNSQKLSKLSTKMIQITLVLLNAQQHYLLVPKQMNGIQLKKYIVKNISDSLTVETMTLKYQGVKITKNMKLSSLNIVTGSILKIFQDKISLDEVQGVVADACQQDPFTGQQGVAKLNCGHHMGKDSMIQFIRSLISAKKYTILCPFKNEDNQNCLAQLDFKLCKKVGVFTKQQTAQFQEGIALNYIKQNTKNCPGCEYPICKDPSMSDRVACPRKQCNQKDFCFICLCPWKKGNGKYCGNDDCQKRLDFVTNAQFNRIFNLKQNGVQKDFKTPQYRCCIFCFTVLQHVQACKHSKCPKCKKQFCWVCLQPKGVSWPCGGYRDYCGKVAQIQKIAL